MEIKEIPTPTMPDWLKLYNTYDPEYYAPGKRVSAEEWNTLFLASVRQGNYNADTLELLIKTYLPETYLTQVDFNQFSNEMRTAYSTFTNNIQEDFIEHKTQTQEQYDTFTTQVQEDFTALTSEVNSLEERVVKAEDVAYSLNDVIQEANEYAQLANQTAIESNTFAQEAKDNASTALETANNAASTAASSNNTAQDALSTAQSAVTTANNAATQATQAVNTANAASLRAEDAIATANASKAESAAAKNTAAQAETTANASNTTAESANDTASEAKRIAQNALDLVTEGQGSQVIVNGVAVDTFNADTKADLDYVDRQIAALIGAAPETLDTLEEVAAAFEENADVVKTLEDAIVTKVAKTDVENFLSATSTNPVQNKVLYDPVTFAKAERNRTINLFNYKTQAETSAITNNQDGSFTISNLTFHYPSLLLNIALKPNTKYTFAETVLEVSDSVGLEASNVAFGVVAYYTDGTYSSTQEIPIRGTGRYSGTFTTNNKTIDYVEYRILRKNNSTSILNGKVTDISVCEGDNTVYYAYEGATVHEEQLKDYLPLAGGKMTGRISFADGNVALPETDDLQFITGIESYAAGGGMIYTHRDTFKQKLLQTNGAIIKGRVYGSGDDEGLIIEKADNGFAGLCLGSSTGTRSVFYLKSDNNATWRWSNGSSSYDISHPQKAGTIALTSDIDAKVNGYLPVSGGNMAGVITFNDFSYSNTDVPTALSYGRLQAYGTLNINGNTDNSGTEYVNITAGHGCSGSTADGLSIGTDTLTWKDQPVLHSGNINNYTVPSTTSNYISSKYFRFCQLQANVGSGFSFATFLITSGGDFGGKFAGTYLVTIGTRDGVDGSMKVLTLQSPSLQGSFKFGYVINADDSNRVDYFMYGATYNFSPVKVVCLTKGGDWNVDTSLVEISEPSSYTTVSANGDIVCGSINLLV